MLIFCLIKKIEKTMKKRIFSVLAVVAVAALAFTSCGKDDPAEPVQPNYGYEATFTGKILIKTNESILSTDPKVWSAPASLNIVARVLNSDLGFTGTGVPTYYTIPANKISYNGSTGEYTVKAPVNPLGTATTIQVSVANFPGKVTKTKTIDANDVDVEVDVIWKSIAYFSTPTGTPGATVYVPARQLSGAAYYDEVVNVGDE
jgi:hypothetical protein